MQLRVRVQHELRKRAVKACDRALHDHEPRAGQLGGHGEVHPESGTDGHMVARCEVQRGWRAPTPNLHVVGFRPPLGHRFVGKVRQREQQVLEFDLDPFEFTRSPLLRARERLDFRKQFVGALVLRLGGADPLRQRLAPCLQLLRLGLQRLATRFEPLEPVQVQLEAASAEPGGNIGGTSPQ
jgi:hypothetical protein